LIALIKKISTVLFTAKFTQFSSSILYSAFDRGRGADKRGGRGGEGLNCPPLPCHLRSLGPVKSRTVKPGQDSRRGRGKGEGRGDEVGDGKERRRNKVLGGEQGARRGTRC
jgi:hypothetical protein